MVEDVCDEGTEEGEGLWRRLLGGERRRSLGTAEAGLGMGVGEEGAEDEEKLLSGRGLG